MESFKLLNHLIYYLTFTGFHKFEPKIILLSITYIKKLNNLINQFNINVKI